MTFTLTGPNSYPSAAYAKIDAVHGAGSVSVTLARTGPADGFTGYTALDTIDNGVERWGDNSAATVDESGSVWIATEVISGGPRTLFANWGTWVGAVAP